MVHRYSIPADDILASKQIQLDFSWPHLGQVFIEEYYNYVDNGTCASKLTSQINVSCYFLKCRVFVWL